MPISEGISRLIVDRATSADIERLATEEGMENMRVASLRRVARGVLSIDEMIRVIAAFRVRGCQCRRIRDGVR